MDSPTIKNRPNSVHLLIGLLSNQTPAAPEALHSTEILSLKAISRQPSASANSDANNHRQCLQPPVLPFGCQLRCAQCRDTENKSQDLVPGDKRGLPYFSQIVEDFDCLVADLKHHEKSSIQAEIGCSQPHLLSWPQESHVWLPKKRSFPSFLCTAAVSPSPSLQSSDACHWNLFHPSGNSAPLIQIEANIVGLVPFNPRYRFPACVICGADREQAVIRGRRR